MGKSAFIAPLYISVSWIMLVSYQLFTQKAADSVIHTIAAYWPSIGGWMITRIDVIVFIHTFAWVWVLSSLIPSLILGNKSSVLIQFLVCLTLAFVALSFMDILSLLSTIPFFPYLGENSVEQIFKMGNWLGKPWIAGFYLSVPYIIMLCVDYHERRKKPIIGSKNEDIRFMRLKDYGFEQAGGNSYETKVVTEGALVNYVERGWEIVTELSDSQYMIKRQNQN